jgi:SAM-dependent methyltransferase
MNYNNHYKKWHDDSEEHLAEMATYYYPTHQLYDGTENDERKILDIGCGTGFFVKSCLDKGYKNIVGIDNSPEQIDVAVRLGLPCKHVEDTIAFLYDHEDYFDVVTMFDVLEHIDVGLQKEMLSAIHQSLKTTGKLIIRTPNANSNFASRFRYIDYTHKISFTEFSLEFLLVNSGFANNEFRQDFYGRLPIWFPRFNVRMMLYSFFYIVRRLNAIAQFGYKDGGRMPLTLNIVSISSK